MTKPAKDTRWVALAAILALAAHLALRLQLLKELDLELGSAIDAGLHIGLLYDVGIVALCLCVSSIVALLFSPKRAVLLAILFVATWAPALANVLHFRFFELRLDWWIVRLHWRDALTVSDSAGQLGLEPWIVLGTLCIMGAASTSVICLAPTFTVARKALITGLMLLVTIVGLGTPQWAGFNSGTVVSELILRVWWREFTQGDSIWS
ncbi:MAG: hypothetical protein AAFQ82_22020, partial [Myxococcota bacterium]